MEDYPKTLLEFEQRCATDEACSTKVHSCGVTHGERNVMEAEEGV